MTPSFGPPCWCALKLYIVYVSWRPCSALAQLNCSTQLPWPRRSSKIERNNVPCTGSFLAGANQRRSSTDASAAFSRLQALSPYFKAVSPSLPRQNTTRCQPGFMANLVINIGIDLYRLLADKIEGPVYWPVRYLGRHDGWDTFFNLDCT